MSNVLQVFENYAADIEFEDIVYEISISDASGMTI